MNKGIMKSAYVCNPAKDYPDINWGLLIKTTDFPGIVSPNQTFAIDATGIFCYPPSGPT